MAEIDSKPFATANGAMKIPTDNAGANNKTTLTSVIDDYGVAIEGLVKTNGFGKFSIDVGGFGLVGVPLATEIETVTSSSGTLTLDVSRSYFFSCTLDENTTIQLPVNINAGSYGRKITLYITQDGTGGHTVAFSALSNRYRPLASSMVVNTEAGAITVIEIFLNSATIHAYNVTPIYYSPVEPPIYSAPIPFEATITSAQILAGVDVVAIPAAGANTYIEIVGRVFCENGAGTTPYDGTQIAFAYGTIYAYSLIETDLAAGTKYFGEVNNVATSALTANQDILFYFLFGTPTTGDYDITVRGFYRIIDLN